MPIGRIFGVADDGDGVVVVVGVVATTGTSQSIELDGAQYIIAITVTMAVLAALNVIPTESIAIST